MKWLFDGIWAGLRWLWVEPTVGKVIAGIVGAILVLLLSASVYFATGTNGPPLLASDDADAAIGPWEPQPFGVQLGVEACSDVAARAASCEWRAGRSLSCTSLPDGVLGIDSYALFCVLGESGGAVTRVQANTRSADSEKVRVLYERLRALLTEKYGAGDERLLTDMSPLLTRALELRPPPLDGLADFLWQAGRIAISLSAPRCTNGHCLVALDYYVSAALPAELRERREGQMEALLRNMTKGRL